MYTYFVWVGISYFFYLLQSQLHFIGFFKLFKSKEYPIKMLNDSIESI